MASQDPSPDRSVFQDGIRHWPNYLETDKEMITFQVRKPPAFVEKLPNLKRGGGALLLLLKASFGDFLGLNFKLI